MTEKLYWDDPYLADFTATIIKCQTLQNEVILELDRTAFYPVGGGQPCDLGLINDVEVVEVTVEENGAILHRLDTPQDWGPGQEVTCRVDMKRRRELMQQHSGQHILSQAFFQLFGAETKGFRINSNSSEIDLALDCSPDFISQAIHEAEDLSNQIVFENRKLHTHLVTVDEAAKLPLRKESFITDCIRVIEIDNYDWSACGGTHVKQTGEVGLITVKGWERAKKMTRLEFLCGFRVLQDYRTTNKITDTLARNFSVSQTAVVDAVHRLSEESRQLKIRNRQLSEMAVTVEAATMLTEAASQAGRRVIRKIFSDHSFDEIKLLAHQLIKTENVVALLAVTSPTNSRLVFAASNDVQADMNNLMRIACELLGGKGGGTSKFAQGGGGDMADLKKVLETVQNKLT